MDGAIDHEVLLAGAQQHAPECIRGPSLDDRPPYVAGTHGANLTRRVRTRHALASRL
jgi:hypothetical protein